jgi:hypothetical protein
VINCCLKLHEVYLLNHNLEKQSLWLQHWNCVIICGGNLSVQEMCWELITLTRHHWVFILWCQYSPRDPSVTHSSFRLRYAFHVSSFVQALSGEKWYWIKPEILWHWLGSTLASRIPWMEFTTNTILSSQFFVRIFCGSCPEMQDWFSCSFVRQIW